jgi:hypothetical protein
LAFYKNSDNVWVQVGSTDWENSWPTAQGAAINPTFTANSTMTINTIEVELSTATTLSAVKDIINAANIAGVTATTLNSKLTFFVDSTATSDGSTEDGLLVLADGDNNPLSEADLAEGTYYCPQIAKETYVGIPSWRATDTVSAPTGSVYVKTSAQGNGLNLAVKRYSSLTQTWTTLAAPAYASGSVATATLDPAGGGNGIAAGSVYIGHRVDENEKVVGYRLGFRKNATGMTITGSQAPTSNAFTVSQTFSISVDTLGSTNSTSATCTIATNGGASSFVAAILAANLPYVTASVTSAGLVSITHQNGGAISLENNSVVNAAGFTSGTTGIAVDVVTGRLVASNWLQGGPAGNPNYQAYTYSFYTPYKAPDDGTLWYYGDAAEVDIMINNGGVWRGYKLVSSDARGYDLTNTDPAGVIVSASEPTTQTDNSQLVPGDLWLDSGDLVNYPALYRYNGTRFVSIDNTDQTSQNGILFADARWDTDGTSDIVTGTMTSVVSLLSSNYLDLDAPDARLYPRGTLLFNTRRSGFNVKQYVSNQFTELNYPDEALAGELPDVAATWQTVSGNKNDGSMFAGPAAQRNMIVKAMQSAVAANTEIREDQYAFNLICAPGYMELIDDMVGLNNDRANTAFVIGDTPFTLKPNAVDIVQWSNNTNGDGLSTADPYLGVYYPSAVSSDVRGNTVVVPPSHIMLRTFIRNDNVSYPWFAPAGVRRGLVDNATDVGYINSDTGEFNRNGISQGLRDTLYTNNLNPITILPGTGLVVWGQKTRNPVASSLDRVNVARLVNYLRTIFAKTGNAFLFEPNDKITRDQIKRIIEGALNDLVAKRGIYDFLVVCDTSNNTPNRIANNELWVDIAIEPMKDVEFIYIPIRLMNPGAIAGA